MAGVRCPGSRANSGRSRVNKWLANTPPPQVFTHLSLGHKNSNMSQAREAAASRREEVVCHMSYDLFIILDFLHLSIWSFAYD